MKQLTEIWKNTHHSEIGAPSKRAEPQRLTEIPRHGPGAWLVEATTGNYRFSG